MFELMQIQKKSTPTHAQIDIRELTKLLSSNVRKFRFARATERVIHEREYKHVHERGRPAEPSFDPREPDSRH